MTSAAEGRHRRRALRIAAAVAVAAVVVVGALRLSPVPVASLLAGDGSREGAATRAQERVFGGEPLVVSVEGDLSSTLSPNGLGALLDFEEKIGKEDGVAAVFGPGTFINETVVQANRLLTEQIGPAARRAVRAATRAEAAARRRGASTAAAARAGDRARVAALGSARPAFRSALVRFGAIGLPSIGNPEYVNAIVFGSGRSTPKARFRWLFPDREHAVVVVRPEHDLADDEVLALGERVRSLARRSGVVATRITVGGTPLVAAAVAREVPRELGRLAPVAAVVMLAVLLIGLRRRGAAAALLGLAGVGTAGGVLAASAVGQGLSVSTVAALPVVLGLAVDYGVQLDARFGELRRAGRPPADAAADARRSLTVVLSLSAAAVAAGGLVLHLSGVPLLGHLGTTLAIGAITALAFTLALGPRVLVRIDRAGRARAETSERTRRTREARIVAAFVRTWRATPRRVRRVAGGAVVAALCAGLALSTTATVQSDVDRLAPSELGELRAAQTVQRQIGSVGEFRVALTGDVITPRAVRWLAALSARARRIDRRITVGPDLGEILGGARRPTSARIAGVLNVVPPHLLQPVLSDDRRHAELSLGLPFVGGREQADLAASLTTAIADPPRGVRAEPAGLVASAGYSLRQLESTRHWLLLACLGLIGALLYAARRSWRRAIVPVVPALAGVGAAGALVALLGVELSPMAAALEPTGFAIGVEFGLLMEARYVALRRQGLDPPTAATRARATIGRAVGLSAATVAAGSIVLVASRIEMLQQLGLLVAVEVVVCAVVAVVAVPRLAALGERRARTRGVEAESGGGPSSGDDRPTRVPGPTPAGSGG